MSKLEKLKLTQYRCFETLDIDFSKEISWFYGENGAGKSTVLESLSLLSRGRPLRKATNKAIIREGEKSALVLATISEQKERNSLGIELQANSIRVRYRGRNLSRTEAASLTPTVCLEQKDYSFSDQEPSYRRSMIDWCLFHVEQKGFYEAWKTYGKALNSRNAALRNRRPDSEVKAWDSALLSSGSLIENYREKAIKGLERELTLLTKSLIPNYLVRTEFKNGCKGNANIASMLDHLESDRKNGYTQFGPHRVDWQLTVGGKPAKQWLSSGQKKLLSLLATAAQIQLVKSKRDFEPLILIDDLTAELDSKSLNIALESLKSTGSQIICSSIEREKALRNEVKLFHVKQGRSGSVIEA